MQSVPYRQLCILSRLNIMKKIITLFLTLAFCGALFAQAEYVTPNLEQIKKETQNKKSSCYYPKLAERFAQADTNFTVADLQAFYFGRAFQKGYNPYSDFDQFGTIRKIFDQEAMPSKGELSLAVSLANEVIKLCPAEPMSYFYKFGALSVLAENYGGDTVEMQKAQLQFQMLFYTIASTGNGTTPQSAMHVVCPSHEYLMMNLYGFAPQDQSLQFFGQSAYDVFNVKENEHGIDSLYFNVDLVLSFWGDAFGEGDKAKADSKKVTSVDVEIGSRVELELVKAKKKNSQFKVVSQDPIYDTLSMADMAKLNMNVPQNHIVFYFFKLKASEDSNEISTCFMFNSNCSPSPLYLNTDVSTNENASFVPENNMGMANGAWMTALWKGDVKMVRVSNIRTQE